MVEEARLESVYTPKGYQGFESLGLRESLKRNASKRFICINFITSCINKIFLLIHEKKSFCA